MRFTRFFEMFGQETIWKRGKVGREGFTIDQMYKAFAQRYAQEQQDYRKIIDEATEEQK